MPEERIPFWEKKKREAARNLISVSEIEYLRFKDPHEDLNVFKETQWEKDVRLALTKVDRFFDVRPEECLLSWLCMWKAANPAQAKQMAIKIRASSWGRRGRFAYRCRGSFIYFSRLPKGEFEDWSEPQQDSYREHERRFSSNGGRPKGTGHPLLTKVWHCEEGHEWLAVEPSKNCPHMLKGQPCPAIVLPGNAPGGTLVVTNRKRRPKPVQSDSG